MLWVKGIMMRGRRDGIAWNGIGKAKKRRKGNGNTQASCSAVMFYVIQSIGICTLLLCANASLTKAYSYEAYDPGRDI
jgi:hypothetical protein